jgi:hypothetical protein
MMRGMLSARGSQACRQVALSGKEQPPLVLFQLVCSPAAGQASLGKACCATLARVV